jgi:hypothetical protein
MEKAELDNRFAQHATDSAKTEKMNTVRSVTRAAADAINAVVPEGREKSIAIKALEDAMMWANKGIASQIDPQPEGV